MFQPYNNLHLSLKISVHLASNLMSTYISTPCLTYAKLFNIYIILYYDYFILQIFYIIASNPLRNANISSEYLF